MMALKRAVGFRESVGDRYDLSTFASDSASQLDVLGHDGDTLGVDGAKVGVFEEADEVGFAGFLESHDCGALESKLGLEVLGDLTYETLEGQFADEQLGTLLVTPDLTKGDSSWPVTMWLLDTTGGRGTLTGGLGCQLFSWSLSSSGFTCGLLGTSHIFSVCVLSVQRCNEARTTRNRTL